MNEYHIPVLAEESIELLDIRPEGSYADLTFGGCGHSSLILSKRGSRCRLYAFDQDADAKANAERIHDDRFTFIESNFRFMRGQLRMRGVETLDGVFADLGVSSHHLDDGSRGFSFRFDSPLDMRMNKRSGTTAADILDSYDEARLADVIYMYGELRQSRRIAAAVVKARREAPLVTTGDLLKVAEPFMTRGRDKKDMARLFQALRIEVNHETDALREMLASAARLLRPGGRLSVITYHSIEDRIVKNMMKSGNAEGRVEQDFFGRRLTPFRPAGCRLTVPSAVEQAANPRSRSAKLRVAEKI